MGKNRRHRAVQPPSTSNETPVVNDEWSDSRNMTAATISSTRPRRPIGCIAASYLRRSPAAPTKAFDHRGCDESRRDGVDADAAPGEFQRDGLGQAFYGVLARVVEAEIGDPDMSGDAARVDDRAAPCAQHRGDLMLHCRDHRPHIDGKDAI